MVSSHETVVLQAVSATLQAIRSDLAGAASKLQDKQPDEYQDQPCRPTPVCC